ncbi:KAP family P-loop NTPase fold protein [Pseudosulfitobacter pseudonitzschiae]|uniref:KAP family P-loop NTPase fold protein n=1 Tax=Pseudosulfitobacter pseudonitzschiae TaxID=1402135 RepID=UPI001AF71D55|nr:P-loop NTPase fold protein [Pseudosulfitobacter pseudonitzschiae]MBM1814002.1 NTPase [Pseudosulfitobacter pseudonitzschiae]MBM1830995.1 NTPase [Pseudosulfitobacter pseudonitzschiae]MBM1835862.1 NTPase [Pseudosulfitobacter pseudonitzschiae]MBM1840708.1 NTPase [Pseudosulfitobacter pseudonitzschiae]MBM1845304.1 NTPase [Pseudosulfitobacter pseudonitzschiae]
MQILDVDSIWADDLLDFAKRGDAFTDLVISISDHRTISIEAGYGRGKTFFRKRWAKQLEEAGECVVQIDARLSDHSGDPVVTFLGALLGLVPEKETDKREAIYSTGKKILMAGGKAIGKAALREGFDEVAGLVAPEDGGDSTLHEIAKAAGQDLSKAAGDLIAKQLSAEKARLDLTEQLKLLHAQITEGRKNNRIIILIDELDRCHPDYAIALLEAMKLVFDQKGFVFVLMVNREYLENIAAHRFGRTVKGEFYLDKFVDLRLSLTAAESELEQAVTVMTSEIPLNIPFGDHPEFEIERAAKLAGKLVVLSDLSMRQVKRTLERVELVCRIYQDRPIDMALLVWLAFNEVSGSPLESKIFPRSQITKAAYDRKVAAMPADRMTRVSEEWIGRENYEAENSFPELISLSPAQTRSPDDGRNYHSWVRVYKHLAPHYIPEHQAMLDMVHKLQAEI